MISQVFSQARFALAVSCLAFGLLPLGAANAQTPDCASESALKSTQAGGAVDLSFSNASAQPRRLYWIDQTGDRKFIAVIPPGNVFKQSTNTGHAWVVTDDAEKCLKAVVAAAESATIDVGGQQQVVTAPTPGAAQPIAPVPVAPPVAGQTAPMAAPAAPPVVAQQPVTPPTMPPAAPAAAMQAPVQPQMAVTQAQQTPPPDVSPVEQFQLSGAYRVSPRTDETAGLNSQASGKIDVARVKPEWDSGQWTFEAVPGTPFVIIRNQWKKTVLTDVDGQLRATIAPPDADEAHWTFEPVDGTNYVQMRNRETDRFLLAANGAPVLADDYRQDQEAQSHWQVAPARGGGSGMMAAPSRPRTPAYAAYDSAAGSCRELGGYWTGSSCRSPSIDRPLSCQPGWAWSSDAGECQWDGGAACPPWQMGSNGVCMTDLTCRGGNVRMSRRGYPVCDCPTAAVAWGSYPNLTCVPSIARILPLLGIAGVQQPSFGNTHGRPTVGVVFGNSTNPVKFKPTATNPTTNPVVGGAGTPGKTVNETVDAKTGIKKTTTVQGDWTTIVTFDPATCRQTTQRINPKAAGGMAPGGSGGVVVAGCVPTGIANAGGGTQTTTTTTTPVTNNTVTTTTAAPNVDAIVTASGLVMDRFNNLDAKTKSDALAQCKRMPANPECYVVLQATGQMTDPMKNAISKCLANPKASGCDKVMSNTRPSDAATIQTLIRVSAPNSSPLPPRMGNVGGAKTPAQIKVEQEAAIQANQKKDAEAKAAAEKQKTEDDNKKAAALQACRNNPKLAGCDQILGTTNPNVKFDPKTGVTLASPTTNTPSCKAGEKTDGHCLCPSSMTIANNICTVATNTNPVGTPKTGTATATNPVTTTTTPVTTTNPTGNTTTAIPKTKAVNAATNAVNAATAAKDAADKAAAEAEAQRVNAANQKGNFAAAVAKQEADKKAAAEAAAAKAKADLEAAQKRQAAAIEAAQKRAADAAAIKAERDKTAAAAAEAAKKQQAADQAKLQADLLAKANAGKPPVLPCPNGKPKTPDGKCQL